MPARRSRSTASRASTRASSPPCWAPAPSTARTIRARALRYQSDACVLFVYLYRKGGTAWQAEFADAYDLQLRPLPVDQCAGSVAAQKKRVA